MPALVRHMARCVDGIDVASGGELQGRARRAAADPREISFAGPGKTRRRAARRRSRPACSINVESMRELRAARRASASALGLPARVAVRVNPDFELKIVRHEDGRRPEAVRHRRRAGARAAARDRRGRARVRGFHIFSGSQNLRAEAICEAQSKALRARAAARRSDAPAPVRVLNIGGGFGIPYFPGEQPLDLAPIGAQPAAPRRARRARRCRRRTLVHRARPLPGRRGRHLRLPRGRSQGLARPGVPGHRRRPAPSPRRLAATSAR